MEVRNASEQDLELLARMNSKLVSEHSSLDPRYATVQGMDSLWMEDIRKHLKDPESAILVAVISGKLVGYLMGTIRERYRIFSERHFAEIWSSFVEAEFRQQGVMKAMFSRFAEWMRGKGVTSVELHSDLRNQEALEAWKCLGFKQVRIQMRARV